LKYCMNIIIREIKLLHVRLFVLFYLSSFVVDLTIGIIKMK
jgi:hypothetical protein